MVAGWTVNRDPAGLTLLRVPEHECLRNRTWLFPTAVSQMLEKRRETDPVEAEFHELNACELTFARWLQQLT